MQETLHVSLNVFKDELKLDKSFSFIIQGHSVVLQCTMHVIVKKVLFCFHFGIIIQNVVRKKTGRSNRFLSL